MYNIDMERKIEVLALLTLNTKLIINVPTYGH